MTLSAMFRLKALALGGKNLTGVPESSPLAVFNQWSRPSLESTQTGREPPNPPAPPLAARDAGGGPPGPRPRPPPEVAFGFSMAITVTAPPQGPDASPIFGISDEYVSGRWKNSLPTSELMA